MELILFGMSCALALCVNSYMYSKTSINDLSGETKSRAPDCNYTTNIMHLEPPRSNHLLFPTSDQFLSPILLKINTFAPLQATKDHTY